MTEQGNKLNKDLILRERLAVQRTTLANQSTFLSFLRTAMYFMMAGLSIRQFIELEYGLIFEILMFTISGVIFLTGLLNYLYQKRKIAESELHVGDYQLEYLNEK
jgi:putative membrane protein